MNRQNRIELTDEIKEYFNEQELRELCHHLDIEYDDLGRARPEKILELVEFCYRHNRLTALVAYCKEKRPHGAWPNVKDDSVTTQQQSKVLDAAIKNQIKVGESTIVLVLVRDSDSKGLRILLGDESDYLLDGGDVRSSRKFQLYYPVDEFGNLLPTDIEIVITSLDFSPSTQSKIIEVAPQDVDNSEPDPVEFMLTPIRSGELQIIVEVYQKLKDVRRRIGSKPLRTVSNENASPLVNYLVMSLLFHATGLPQSAITNYSPHIGDRLGYDNLSIDNSSIGNLIQTTEDITLKYEKEFTFLRTRLFEILDKRFSVEDLKVLCFSLDVHYEGLPGKSQSEKSLELIKYLTRNQRLNVLVDYIKGNRKDIDI